MDRDFYYNAIDRMEKATVQREYIQGWIAGYLQNPRREEQRITEAYEAGFAHGGDSEADSFSEWTAAGGQ